MDSEPAPSCCREQGPARAGTSLGKVLQGGGEGVCLVRSILHWDCVGTAQGGREGRIPGLLQPLESRAQIVSFISIPGGFWRPKARLCAGADVTWGVLQGIGSLLLITVSMECECSRLEFLPLACSGSIDHPSLTQLSEWFCVLLSLLSARRKTSPVDTLRSLLLLVICKLNKVTTELTLVLGEPGAPSAGSAAAPSGSQQ